MKKVTVIDYGIGNLLSVSRAFEYWGAEVILAGSPEAIARADRLVLPGVGAFADGMAGLKNRCLVDPMKEYASKGRPFLGICLGMQMMLDTSEEFGNHQGLGLISGKVAHIPHTGVNGQPHKIPHIGWNQLIPGSGKGWPGTVLSDIKPGSSVYFVHSFTSVPSRDEHRLADCLYNGRVISAVIKKDLLYGCQFHPEKSGEVGLKILKNFIDLA